MTIKPTEEHDKDGLPIFDVDPATTAEEFADECGRIPHSGPVALRWPNPPPQWVLEWRAHTNRLARALDALATREQPEDDEE